MTTARERLIINKGALTGAFSICHIMCVVGARTPEPAQEFIYGLS